MRKLIKLITMTLLCVLLISGCSNRITSEDVLEQTQETADVTDTADSIDTSISIDTAEEETASEDVFLEMNALVANLDISKECSQIIIVAAKGSGATVSMHQKSGDGTWTEIVNTLGVIGENGIGKTEEGDGKTPVGVYTLSQAFGVEDNPGTDLPYTKLDDSDYWVDDPDSEYYNQFVSINDVEMDWKSAEHLEDSSDAYAYAIPIDYNTECKKGAGSAIFLHCFSGGATSGCIAIPQDSMITILTNITEDCVILIDEASNISTY